MIARLFPWEDGDHPVGHSMEPSESILDHKLRIDPCPEHGWDDFTYRIGCSGCNYAEYASGTSDQLSKMVIAEYERMLEHVRNVPEGIPSKLIIREDDLVQALNEFLVSNVMDS